MIDFQQIIQQILSNNSTQMSQISRRIEKAKQMTSIGYSLWGRLLTDTAIGVIQSQSDENRYYFTFIRADGTYGCFDNNIEPCLGQPLYISNYRKRPGRYNQWLQNQQPLGNSEYKGRWEYALPCKHIFSLLNGFCMQAGPQIQEILEDWIRNSLNEHRGPIRDGSYAKFIQSQFSPVKNKVLERTVFKPLLNEHNKLYAVYRPTSKVKILDKLDKGSESRSFELHVQITTESIEPLPMKNIICISCLQREHDEKKLERWVKCKQCLSQICQSCYEQLKIAIGYCPSVFNGYKEHKLDVIAFSESLQKKIESKNSRSKMNFEKKVNKDVIFKFGEP